MTFATATIGAMSTSPHSILFLNGAGLPPWIWDEVRHRLDDSYETQVASRPHGDATRLRDYVEAAIDSVAADRVTIVAHSAGGVVGAEVARVVAERVTGFLAVTAVVPQPGGSFVSAMPVPNRWILGAAMRVAGTRPPDSAIRKTLAHGIDDQTTDQLIADFTPEPQSYYRDRTDKQTWDGRKGYVITTNDREIPSALQRRFSMNLGAKWQRELATGHLAMVENPEALGETITQFLEWHPDSSD